MDFYYRPGSAPCRSVIMLAHTLDLKINKIILNLQNGEHLKPEFLKLNPQHTIPTLVDDGFSIWESHAILIYLVEKYAKTDTLYPKDQQKRAVVNQRLFFDVSVLFKSFGDYYYPIIFGKEAPNQASFPPMETAFEFLNTFLEGQTYVAGNILTIADLSILSSVSNFDVAGFDIKKYANVAKWYEHCKEVVPGWDENWEGSLFFKRLFVQSK